MTTFENIYVQLFIRLQVTCIHKIARTTSTIQVQSLASVCLAAVVAALYSALRLALEVLLLELLHVWLLQQMPVFEVEA